MEISKTTINVPRANLSIFQKTVFILGTLTGLSLFGYAIINLIRMPDWIHARSTSVG